PLSIHGQRLSVVGKLEGTRHRELSVRLLRHLPRLGVDSLHRHRGSPRRRDFLAVRLERVRLPVHRGLHSTVGRRLVRDRRLAEIAFAQVHLPLAQIGRIGRGRQPADTNPQDYRTTHSLTSWADYLTPGIVLTIDIDCRYDRSVAKPAELLQG